MKESKAKAMVRRLKEQGHSAEIYEGYSGRCMYGKKCYGVVTDKNMNPPKGCSKDNMGLDWIYYNSNETDEVK